MPKAKKINEKEKSFYGTGKRKTAVASVLLYPKKGEFVVNGLDIKDYFTSEEHRTNWMKPFFAIGVSHPGADYSASIKVFGSGKASQFDAVVLGISRALEQLNAEFGVTLRHQGLLTRDSREVERKKYFLRKARKRPQYSKR